MKLLNRTLLVNFIFLISILSAETFCPNGIDCKVIYNDNNKEAKIAPNIVSECRLPNMPIFQIKVM